MLKESKADIFVDPVLHTACALDLKHHCAAITPGRGRRECFYMLNSLTSNCSPAHLVVPQFGEFKRLSVMFFNVFVGPSRPAEMSCLMEALQDKRVRLQPECKKRLQDRIDMWSYAAKVIRFNLNNHECRSSFASFSLYFKPFDYRFSTSVFAH